MRLPKRPSHSWISRSWTTPPGQLLYLQQFRALRVMDLTRNVSKRGNLICKFNST
jgi:hypothetical protein